MTEQQSSTQLPQEIKMAVVLLWVSIIAGIGKVLMDFTALNSLAPPLLTNLALVFSFAMMIFVTTNVAKGKFWARTILALMFAVGTLPTLTLLQSDFSRSLFLGLLSAAQISCQAYALYLVFTKPGSIWFRRA